MVFALGPSIMLLSRRKKLRHDVHCIQDAVKAGVPAREACAPGGENLFSPSEIVSSVHYCYKKYFFLSYSSAEGFRVKLLHLFLFAHILRAKRASSLSNVRIFAIHIIFRVTIIYGYKF